MANTPIVPQNFSVVINQGLAQTFKSQPVLDFSSAPVDLSTWGTLVAKAIPAAPGLNTADVSFGTVTADSAGIITLNTSITDLAGLAAGSSRLVIHGTPSGGTAQIMSSGTLTLYAG